MTYEIRAMPPEHHRRWYCSRIRELGDKCWRRAYYYLVAKPERTRQRRYTRCEDCARLDAAAFAISMPKEPQA